VEDFAGSRRRLEQRRAALAAAAAQRLVARLCRDADQRSDPAIEDELCVGCGAQMWEWSQAEVDDHVSPDTFAEALVDAATGALAAALAGPAEPVGWQASWRVFGAVVRIVPERWRAWAVEAAASLRRGTGGDVLPDLPAGPTVTGAVRWMRDGYGSRFGVVAPVSALGGGHRWYLWDVDACGMKAVTVHSGFFPTVEEAVAEWRAGVGPAAAGSAVLRPVDDVPLLAALLPTEEGIMRIGGENAAQFAEYHRSRRLAEAVWEAIGPVEVAADEADAADDGSEPISVREAAVDEFVVWLDKRRARQPAFADLGELADDLANSWSSFGPAALYRTCSPHRVAETVSLLRDYYGDDHADELIGLLPEWTAWLAECNGTPAELADRCAPYSAGKPYPGTEEEQGGNPTARVGE
jgi:hypothetical protein